MQNPTDFTFADPSTQNSLRRWWVLYRTLPTYRQISAEPVMDTIAGMEILRTQSSACEVAFLTDGEVRQWTQDIVEGMSPERRALWDRFITHTHAHSPEERFPVGVIEITIAPVVASDRLSFVRVYEGDDIEALVTEIESELGDDPTDEWGDSVFVEFVPFSEGVELGSEEHQSRYRSWLTTSRFA